MPRSQLERLDAACRGRVRSHFRELLGGENDYLSDEDVLGAAAYGDQIYLDHTDMPATECSDRALEIAYEVRGEFNVPIGPAI